MRKRGGLRRNQVLESLCFAVESIKLYGPDGDSVADLVPGVALSSARLVSEVERLKLAPGVYVAPQIGKAVLVCGESERDRHVEQGSCNAPYTVITGEP